MLFSCKKRVSRSDGKPWQGGSCPGEVPSLLQEVVSKTRVKQARKRIKALQLSRCHVGGSVSQQTGGVGLLRHFINNFLLSLVLEVRRELCVAADCRLQTFRF